MGGFGNNTNMGSAKYVPYLYDRIKSIVLSFTNSSILSASLDNISIPTEHGGNSLVYTNTDNAFKVFYGGVNQTSNWTIDVLSETNVTTSQVDNVIYVTNISAEEGEYIVRAVRPDYATITKTVKVYASEPSSYSILISDISNVLIPASGDGTNPIFDNTQNEFKVFYSDTDQTNDWTISVTTEVYVTTTIINKTVSVDSLNGDYGEYIVTATRSGYDDITKLTKVYKARFGGQGLDGLGWTGGSYNSVNGTVTFSSTDGLGFSTSDLRGADGVGTPDEITIVSDVSNIMSANLIDVNSDKSTYFINKTNVEDPSDMPFTASNNIILNSTWGNFDDWGAGAELDDNIFLSSLPVYLSGQDHHIKHNLIYTPAGYQPFPLSLFIANLEGLIYLKNSTISGSNNIAAGRPLMKDGSVGIGNYPNTYNHGSFALSVKTSDIGGEGVRDIGDTTTYASTYITNSKTYQTLECWTDCFIRGDSSADLIFGNTEEFKVYYQNRGTSVYPLFSDNITSEYCAHNVYDGSPSDIIFIANSKINIIGRDLVTLDYFFAEIGFLNINGAISDITINKTSSIGTLIGSTIQFTATTATNLIPEVVSASTNPCKWSALLSIDDIYSYN